MVFCFIFYVIVSVFSISSSRCMMTTKLIILYLILRKILSYKRFFIKFTNIIYYQFVH